jgi:hypothetical protein
MFLQADGFWPMPVKAMAPNLVGRKHRVIPASWEFQDVYEVLQDLR